MYKDSVLNHWNTWLYLYILLLSLFCSLWLLSQQTAFSLCYHCFWLFSSVLLWDPHPGNSSGRRLWCNPVNPHHLCGGEVLQEEAHGKRYWNGLTGAGVEGPDCVVRARELELLSSSASRDCCGSLGRDKWKRGRKVSFLPCLLLQSDSLLYYCSLFASVLDTMPPFPVVVMLRCYMFIFMFYMFLPKVAHDYNRLLTFYLEILKCWVGDVNMDEFAVLETWL